MYSAYFIVGLLGVLAASLVGWVIAGEVGERRKARAAVRIVGRFQRSDSTPERDPS